MPTSSQASPQCGNQLLTKAREYQEYELCVIGCSNKKPVSGSWSQFRERMATEAELEQMFIDRRAEQIAIICGHTSSELEVIDVDLKNQIDPDTWARLADSLSKYFNGLDRLCIVRTISGGYHIFFRVDNPNGNQKLASIVKDGKPVTLIETRGEGGYVIAAPSLGYTVVHGSMDRIPIISDDQMEDVYNMCREFNEVYKEVASKPKTGDYSGYKDTPWDEYNADLDNKWQDLLFEQGWTQVDDKGGRVYYLRPGATSVYSANWHTERRLLYVWSSSTAFEPEKAYSPFAILSRLKFNDDHKAAVKYLRENGYGKMFSGKEQKAISQAVVELGKGMSQADVINMIMAIDFDSLTGAGVYDEQQAVKIVEVAEGKKARAIGQFWTRTQRGELQVQFTGVADILDQMGIRLMVQEEFSLVYRVVRVNFNDHLIREMSLDMIKKALWDHVKTMSFAGVDIDLKQLKESIMRIGAEAWANIIQWIDRLELDKVKFLRDTANKSWVPFRNGLVQITNVKDADYFLGVNLVPFDTLPEGVLIWENAIKPWNIELINSMSEIDRNQSNYYRFIKRLAGVKEDKENLELQDLAQEDSTAFHKLVSIITHIGYLCSNYKDRRKPFAVVVAEDTANDGLGGGTGKGLIFQGIAKIREVSELFGKDWKPDKSFAFQTVKMSCDVLVFQDITKWFKADALYNVITEGLMIEKKNKDTLVIPFGISPKAAMTTNYDVLLEGNHAKRRFKKILLTKHYDDKFSPFDEFGEYFFEEWNEHQTNLFYNVMFFFLQSYIGIGIHAFTETENAKIKSVSQAYGIEFYEFMIDYLDKPMREAVPSADLYSDFLKENDFEKKDYSNKRFFNGVDLFCSKFGYTREKSRETTRTSGSHGSRLTRIRKNDDTQGTATRDESPQASPSNDFDFS